MKFQSVAGQRTSCFSKYGLSLVSGRRTLPVTSFLAGQQLGLLTSLQSEPVRLRQSCCVGTGGAGRARPRPPRPHAQTGHHRGSGRDTCGCSHWGRLRWAAPRTLRLAGLVVLRMGTYVYMYSSQYGIIFIMPPCHAELKLSGINFVKHMHFYKWVPDATSAPSFYHWFLLGKSDQFSFGHLCLSGSSLLC